MSATKPANRTEFKEYCLRRLGKPVIQINVDDSQVEDLIDEALDYFQKNHFDGSMKVYLPLEITAQVKQNRYFELDPSIIGVTGVLRSEGIDLSSEWDAHDLEDVFSLKGDGIVSLSIALGYQDLIKEIIGTKYKPIRFSYHTQRLYVDTNWNNVSEGEFFVVDAVKALDPDEFPQVWNDPFLKKYATALIKRQWGNNLRKLRNVQLVGGVTIDADSILNEAEQELRELKDAILSEYQEPLDFFMG